MMRAKRSIGRLRKAFRFPEMASRFLDPIEEMKSWAAYGDLVHLRFMRESMYLVTHPDLIKQILDADSTNSSLGRNSRRPSQVSKITQ